MTDHSVGASLPGAAPLVAILDECEREFDKRHDYTNRDIAEWLLAHGVSVGAALEAGPAPPDMREVKLAVALEDLFSYRAHKEHCDYGIRRICTCGLGDTITKARLAIGGYFVAPAESDLRVGVRGESVPPLPNERPSLDAMFHRLWTKYAALPNYVKAEWTAAYNEIWMRERIAPCNSGNAGDSGVLGPPQEKPSK